MFDEKYYSSNINFCEVSKYYFIYANIYLLTIMWGEGFDILIKFLYLLLFRAKRLLFHEYVDRRSDKFFNDPK